ncbi:hypothetical protein KA005_69380, partial [bacterium]|nr:hypothetical protein [bacterium]
IILPLLTSNDQQLRLQIYRSWREFHLSILGNDWKNLISGWAEDCRVDFFGEVLQDYRLTELAEEIALNDPSPKVKATALSSLEWLGAVKIVSKILDTLNDDEFDKIIEDRVIYTIPEELYPKVLRTFSKFLNRAVDPIERLRIQIKMAKIGGTQASDEIKNELDKWPSGKIKDIDRELLSSTLKFVKMTDSKWINNWVTRQIIDGPLWGEYWKEFISDIEKDLRQKLFKKISEEDLNHKDSIGIISVLTATADSNFAVEVLSSLCYVRVQIQSTSKESARKYSAILRQIEQLYRELNPNIAVEGLLNRKSEEFDAVEYECIISVFGFFGIEGPDLRGQLRDDLRQKLRKYFKHGLSFVLNQIDHGGKLKADLSSSLARVGDPEDMIILNNLIRVDIKRIRQERSDLMRGKLSPLTGRAIMSQTNRLIQAVMMLDAQRAEDVLLRILSEPEYEEETVRALIQLAKTQDFKGGLGFNSTDFSVIGKFRAFRPPIPGDSGQGLFSPFHFPLI